MNPEDELEPEDEPEPEDENPEAATARVDRALAYLDKMREYGGVALDAAIMHTVFVVATTPLNELTDVQKEELKRLGFIADAPLSKEERLAQYPNRRWFLCYFRQQPNLGPFGGGELAVSFVHPKSFPPDQRDEARKLAEELEARRYAAGDFNLQVVARLAADEDAAKRGVFLDYLLEEEV